MKKTQLKLNKEALESEQLYLKRMNIEIQSAKDRLDRLGRMKKRSINITRRIKRRIKNEE